MFSAWWVTNFSYPWCFAGALRAPKLRYNLSPDCPSCLVLFKMKMADKISMSRRALSKVTSPAIERFSFGCRKVIGFAFTTLRDWLKKLAPLFHPIRSKTKTNRDSLVRVLPHFASATCNYLAFWLVHLIICALCDWLEWLLWFWFYDTQLKTAPVQPFYFIPNPVIHT